MNRILLAFLLLLAAALVAFGDMGAVGNGNVGGVMAPTADNAQQGQCVCPIKDLSGIAFYPGVIESQQSMFPGTGFELVWSSTPTVTSGSGHAKIWLNQQGSTKSALKIEFDDGTIVSIANN